MWYYYTDEDMWCICNIFECEFTIQDVRTIMHFRHSYDVVRLILNKFEYVFHIEDK